MASPNGSKTLADIVAGDRYYVEPPSRMERIGRGMSDVVEPLLSLYYKVADPVEADHFNAQRDADEALYLRGLLPNIPAQLRGAVPDTWRAFGQSAPFFALGPGGGLPSLTARGLSQAAASVLSFAGIGQPITALPDVWRYLIGDAQSQGQP